MRLTELDEALALALPLQFELRDAFCAISDKSEPTMREALLLGAALTERGYAKVRTMTDGVRKVVWKGDAALRAEKLAHAQTAWELAAEAELAARNHYHALQRAIR